MNKNQTRKMVNQLLDQTSMSKQARKRLLALALCPCRDCWDNAYSVVINSKYTLWQAIIAIDPTFPRTGKRVDRRGFIVKDWTDFPDSDKTIRAIQHAVKASALGQKFIKE